MTEERDHDHGSTGARVRSTPPAATTASSGEPAQHPAPAPRERPVGSADAVTRRIRNPLLDPPPKTPAKSASTPTPVLAPPRDEEATPEVVVEVDVSKNIHVFPITTAPLELPLPRPTVAAPNKRHGAIVVTTVVLAGAAIDIFLWKTCGSRPATVTTAPPAMIEPARTTPVVQPDGAGPNARAMPLLPAPARSHVEITVHAAQATLVLDGKVLDGNPVKLDVASDRQPHLLEVTAPGFARFSRSVSFARDLDLVIELQRAPPPVQADATVAPTRAARATARTPQPIRARAPARRNAASAADPWATGSRRSTSAIDEADPYAP